MKRELKEVLDLLDEWVDQQDGVRRMTFSYVTTKGMRVQVDLDRDQFRKAGPSESPAEVKP